VMSVATSSRRAFSIVLISLRSRRLRRACTWGCIVRGLGIPSIIALRSKPHVRRSGGRLRRDTDEGGSRTSSISSLGCSRLWAPHSNRFSITGLMTAPVPARAMINCETSLGEGHGRSHDT
jgi:hypothetical protein